jgi:outer membrane protein OmpA-like peptidoglycan-associated protein
MASRHKATVAALVLLLGSGTLGCGGAQTVKPRIIEDGTSIVIVDDANDSIPIEIRFEVDSHVLRASSHAPLDALAEFLQAREDYTLIEVHGHSDERGTEAYNRSLSKRRAQSVIDYLVTQGIERDRLRAKGFGSSRPAVQGTDESAWSQNRRVEFVIIEQTG